MQALNAERVRQLEPAGDVEAIRSGPVRVLQIGTGNFLRAFSGWMFERMNRTGVFRGTLAVAPATPGSATAGQLARQEGCYTVLQRGLRGDQLIEVIDRVTCVTQIVSPFEQWADYLQLAASPELRYVVSNTTEAGIVYRASPRPSDASPASFPAQMCALLHHRFMSSTTPPAGLVFLPCELIEANGTALRDAILRHAAGWALREPFADWVRTACVFCNTLVDRIVTGSPKTEASDLETRLGYHDELLTACELYHNWIIEGPRELARELPFREAGLNVTWTDDAAPYRTRKVRILNGAHTTVVAAAFLAGADTVLDCMNDADLSRFLQEALGEEIVPCLANDEETRAFATDVVTRFRNPTIQHRLLSIALNSTSKWKVRVLPSLRAFVEQQQRLPRRLAFSLAALVALYRVRIDARGIGIGARNGQPYELADTPEALRLLSEAWKTYDDRGDVSELSRTVVAARSLWDADLTQIPELVQQLASDLQRIERRGMRFALQQASGDRV